MKNNNKVEGFLLIETVLKLLSRCSLACLFTLVRFFSFIVAHTKNQVSKNTKQNISFCFADKNAQEKKNFYTLSINHTVASLIEMASIWYHPIEKVLAQIKKENVSANYKADSGAKIIIVPHFGSWELMTFWLAKQGLTYALYKPARSTQLDNYILNKRTRNGAILVPTNLIGLRTLLKGLKAGATVMILPDQKPNKESAKINSQFYGYDASTSLLIKNLTKKVSCSVYIAAAIRNLDEANYNVQLNNLEVNQFLLEDQKSADYLNQSIEQFIAIDETQYQWSYQRFSKKMYSQSS